MEKLLASILVGIIIFFSLPLIVWFTVAFILWDFSFPINMFIRLFVLVGFILAIVGSTDFYNKYDYL
jgi:hypothetical protein